MSDSEDSDDEQWSAGDFKDDEEDVEPNIGDLSAEGSEQKMSLAAWRQLTKLSSGSSSSSPFEEQQSSTARLDPTQPPLPLGVQETKDSSDEQWSGDDFKDDEQEVDPNYYPNIGDWSAEGTGQKMGLAGWRNTKKLSSGSSSSFEGQQSSPAKLAPTQLSPPLGVQETKDSSDEQWSGDDFKDDQKDFDPNYYPNIGDWGAEGTGQKMGLAGWRQLKKLSSGSSSSHFKEQQWSPAKMTPTQPPSSLGVQEPKGHYMQYMHGPGTYHEEDVPYPYQTKVGTSISKPRWPKSTEEDIPILRRMGLEIEYTNEGRLGGGCYGTVYRGKYGAFLNGIAGIKTGDLFAVKIIDFKKDMLVSDQPIPGTPDTGDSEEAKEMTESEKFIVTNAQHPRIVEVKMIFNMGEPKIHTFVEAPANTYVCYERVYIFMELSDGGTLSHWLPRRLKGMNPWLRIRLIRDLFDGLMFLHANNIVHGDIHDKNILLFQEEGRWVAKWTDFGSGCVSEAGNQYLYKRPISRDEYTIKLREDIFRMGHQFKEILALRKMGEPETQWEKQTLDQLWQLAEDIRIDRPYDIMPLYEKYKDALAGQQPLVEVHVQQD